MIEGHTELAEQLKKFGVQVHYFPQNQKHEIFEMLKQLSKIVEREEKAKQLMAQFDARLQALKQKLKLKNKKLLFEVWMDV